MYDRTTVQGATLTCVVNCTTGTPTPRLCSVVQWSMHWAPSRTTRVLVTAGARRCVLETCGKKKIRTPLLGLAKSIYYLCYTDTARLGESVSPFSNVWLSGVKYTFFTFYIFWCISNINRPN